MKLNNCTFCQKQDLEPLSNGVKFVYSCDCGAKYSVVMLESEPFYANAAFDNKLFYGITIRRVRKGLSILIDTSKNVRDNKPVASVAKRTTDGSSMLLGALF